MAYQQLVTLQSVSLANRRPAQPCGDPGCVPAAYRSRAGDQVPAEPPAGLLDGPRPRVDRAGPAPGGVLAKQDGAGERVDPNSAVTACLHLDEERRGEGTGVEGCRRGYQRPVQGAAAGWPTPDGNRRAAPKSRLPTTARRDGRAVEVGDRVAVPLDMARGWPAGTQAIKPAGPPSRWTAQTGGAGDGNRTRMTSLEGWSSAIELRPRTCGSSGSVVRPRNPPAVAAGS
jgi:hypothetical protein